MDQKNGILMTFIFSSTANLCVSDGKRKARVCGLGIIFQLQSEEQIGYLEY